MMMYEVLSHEKAYGDYRWTHHIFMNVIEGKRLPIRVFPKSVPAPHGYRSLLEKCWSQEPDYRPDFTIVLNALRDMIIVKCRSKMSDHQAEQNQDGYGRLDDDGEEP